MFEEGITTKLRLSQTTLKIEARMDEKSTKKGQVEAKLDQVGAKLGHVGARF